MRFFLLTTIATFAIVSCNPVKQVLKDKVKFDKVAEEVIRRGYCVNDTIIETVVDTLYKTDSIIVNVTKFTGGKLDTIFADGSGLYMDDQGNVSVKCPVKQQVRTVTKIETIRDRSLENILKNDIHVLDSTKTALLLSVREREVSIKELNQSILKYKARFFALIGSLVLVLGFILFKKFRGYLPF